MEYTKQPITLVEQINILKQRGLIFENENEALSVLNHISYFRLASYWRVMEENSRIHRFRSSSYFSAVLSLYTFDSELRSLVFNALQHIEIASRLFQTGNETLKQKKRHYDPPTEQAHQSIYYDTHYGSAAYCLHIPS